MCGRFVSPDEAAIERAWHVGREGNAPFARRYNVAPTAIIPLLHLDYHSGRLALAGARWGLIPHWWKASKPPGFSFNARIEEAASRPMWRDACRTARCLIPAEGWYEWREGTHDASGRRRRQPYFIRPRDRQPFCFAGVMARWLDRTTGESVTSCAVLTTAAAGALATLHERMPVVLTNEAHGAWMDTTNDSASAAALARAAAMNAVDRMEHYAVSPRVNDARMDQAQLLEPVSAGAS
ncbi:MAG: SOS response-associated peptidase [Betaproteobacteria bacterium]